MEQGYLRNVNLLIRSATANCCSLSFCRFQSLWVHHGLIKVTDKEAIAETETEMIATSMPLSMLQAAASSNVILMRLPRTAAAL